MVFKCHLSYCLKDEKPESEHQFHFMGNGEPTSVDWEAWLLSRIYSNILLDLEWQSVDFSNPKDKRLQVIGFLEYHLLKFDGEKIDFVRFIGKAIILLRSSINANEISDYDRKWINEEIEKWGLAVEQHEKEFPTDDNKKRTEKEIKSFNYFKLSFMPGHLMLLYRGLTIGGFLPEDPTGKNYKAFCYIFGGNGELKDFKPLMWIKTNSTTHGKMLNKRSLLDLLELLKVPQLQITDKKSLNKLFVKPDRTSIKFTTSNYQGTKKNFNSEYHNELEQIINRIK